MIRRFVLALAACTALSAPAFALDTPPVGRGDPNVKAIPYNPTHRVLLVGVLGHVTVLTFEPSETVSRASFGKDDVWEGPKPDEFKGRPMRNNFMLWPKTKEPENLLITTVLPDGSERIYQFALQAIDPPADGSDPPEATYGLTFTYAAPVIVHTAAQDRQAKQAKERTDGAAAEARLRTDVFYGVRKWRYEWRGDPDLVPSEASDNGRLTAFRWPGNRAIPAIYEGCAPDPEKLVPWVIQDDFVVIQTTARCFTLRQGTTKVAQVRPLPGTYDPVGPDPRTGTTSPEVLREVKSP